MTTTKPETFEQLLKTARTIYSEDKTFEDWSNFRDLILNEKEYLLSVINKETLVTLKKFTYYADRKENAVSSVFSSISQALIMGGSFSYSPMEETSEAALKRITSAYTEETYIKYKEKLRAEFEAKQKAMNNPETLDEFRTFISRLGKNSLSAEQLARYDELVADMNKKIKEHEEKKKAQIQQVSNVSAEMEIKESFHAKKNIPLWVVVLNTRVERSVYEELNNRAKKLGGYYSSFRGNGAIPGFTFDNIDAAKLFVQVKDGSVDASELKQEVAEAKQQTKAEALKEKAQKLIDDGEEELNRDRKDNTHRRAAMADNAEKRASAQIQFGKTLLKIAEAIESGEIKYLDKISNGKDLEVLQFILSIAKSSHIRAKQLRREEYHVTTDTVNWAELPYPILYSNTKEDLEKMKSVNGKKLAASRMLKRFGNSEFITINNPQRVEDYETLFCTKCSVISDWQINSYKERLMHMKRLKRIGIDTIEELRAALRELVNLKKGTAISDEQKRALQIKELERQFIGAKIPGFFPTPQTLAAQVVKLANIQEGESVLEPSAGLGHIADEIRSAHPSNELLCIEYNSKLAEALKLKGYTTINEDFLSMFNSMSESSSFLRFDKIIMNPPFEDGQDVKHVVNAFNLLNKGGRLVAIMANNKQRYPDFMGLVNTYGTIEENPDGSFASAFRPTGISTVTVILDK